jgi:predicted DNA-binding transcriptional regulator AlpA
MLLDDLISRADLAARLGRNPRTLDLWEKTGKGPRRTKIGQGVFYLVRDVDRWIAAASRATNK